MQDKTIQQKQPEKVIELKNVAVSYKERKSFFKSTEYKALKDVSFDVYKGEVLGVIGRNGAGKSTLLRLLAGIIKPDGGEVIHHTKSVSLMALAAGFDPNLSGRQNTIISGMLMGYSKNFIKEKIEEIKTFSELQEFYEKPTKTYSSGMRARLAFSIAMYVSPDVLLIDEVLGVGDASFRKKAEQALHEKIASDITVIFVSHFEQQVRNLSDRIVWIEDGVVRKEGAPEHIFPEYNINTRFSTFGLMVEKYEINEDFSVHLENVKFNGNQIYFDCIIIDKKDRSIDTIKCINEAGMILSSHSQGYSTPIFEKKWPRNNSAKHARYSPMIADIGKDNVCILNENINEIVVFCLRITRF